MLGAVNLVKDILVGEYIVSWGIVCEGTFVSEVPRPLLNNVYSDVDVEIGYVSKSLVECGLRKITHA